VTKAAAAAGAIVVVASMIRMFLTGDFETRRLLVHLQTPTRPDGARRSTRNAVDVKIPSG